MSMTERIFSLMQRMVLTNNHTLYVRSVIRLKNVHNKYPCLSLAHITNKCSNLKPTKIVNDGEWNTLLQITTDHGLWCAYTHHWCRGWSIYVAGNDNCGPSWRNSAIFSRSRLFHIL